MIKRRDLRCPRGCDGYLVPNEDSFFCTECRTWWHAKEEGFILHYNAQSKKDIINNPAHYTQGKFECIDVIQDLLSTSPELPQPLYWLWGQLIRYVWRWPHKNGVEDLRKARYYIDKMIETLE